MLVNKFFMNPAFVFHSIACLRRPAFLRDTQGNAVQQMNGTTGLAAPV